MDALNISGSPETLTAAHVNFLSNVTSNVQDQLDLKANFVPGSPTVVGNLLMVAWEYISEAEAKAELILNRNMATHTYFSNDLKPALFELTDSCRSLDCFAPVWISSTYAIRETDIGHSVCPDCLKKNYSEFEID